MSSQLNNRPSFLKDIVYMVMLAILIGGVNEYLQRYDYDVWALADDYDKQHGLGKYDTIQPNVESETESNVDVQTEVSSEQPKTGVVYIHGLGDYNQSDLITAKNAVESFYGLPCVIGSPVNVSGDYYTGSYIIGSRIAGYNAYNENRHVYITNEPICDSPDDLSLTSGVARNGTKSCFVSTYQMKQNGRDIPSSVSHTVKHEMGHNFGLGHCDNQSCLMKTYGLDTHEFCDECKRKINN
jgi:hypothetical protein